MNNIYEFIKLWLTILGVLVAVVGAIFGICYLVFLYPPTFGIVSILAVVTIIAIVLWTT